MSIQAVEVVVLSGGVRHARFSIVGCNESDLREPASGTNDAGTNLALAHTSPHHAPPCTLHSQHSHSTIFINGASPLVEA